MARGKRSGKPLCFQGKVSEAYGNPVDVPLSGSAWFSMVQHFGWPPPAVGDPEAVRCSDRG